MYFIDIVHKHEHLGELRNDIVLHRKMTTSLMFELVESRWHMKYSSANSAMIGDDKGFSLVQLLQISVKSVAT